MFFSQVNVRVDVAAIGRNYQRLAAVGKNLMPVIKADAYGHGLEATAEILSGLGAQALAVGSVEEAVRLRETGFNGRIVSLLGPVDKEDARAVQESRLLAFVYRLEQLEYLNKAAEVSARSQGPLPVALKFDSGMGRLGFALSEVDRLVQTLPRLPSLKPVMAASHLATADDPDSRDFVLEQGSRFEAILRRIRDAGQPVQGCLVNSAGLLAYPEFHFDIQRPGITLYGCNPFHGTNWQAKGDMLEPAMEATAPVLQVHDLPKGRPINYGRLYTASEDKRVAIIAAGYSDLYSRGLSSRNGKGAAMVLHGKRAPVLGRVCMQLTAVDVSHIPEAKAGDTAWILGGQGTAAVRAEELANWWGTISYEVLTDLGLNTRTYNAL